MSLLRPRGSSCLVMMNNVEHPFIRLVAMSTSSWVRCLLRLLARFSTGLFTCLLLNFKGPCTFWLQVLHHTWVLQIFFPTLHPVFHRRGVFNFNKIQLIKFYFDGSTFPVPEESLPILSTQSICSIFFHTFYRFAYYI